MQFDARQRFTFDQLVREHARSRPAQIAVVDGDVRFTYPELDARIDRLAGALAGEGAVDGERVLWLGQNSFRVLELLLACARTGAIFCPANWRQSAAELAFIVDDLEPHVVVWQDEEVGATALEARAAARSEALWLQHDDPAGYEAFLASGPAFGGRDVDPLSGLLALYTAAFGGQPNAAVLSHVALLFQNLVIGRMQDVTDRSVFLNSGPLFHIATFVTTNAILHHGGTNVFVRRVDADEICRIVDAERCTHAFLMPPTIEQIREVNSSGRYDLSSLWDAPDPNRFRGGMISPAGAPWYERPGGFGQTEVVGLTTFVGLGEQGSGGAGRASPASLVGIVDPDGREVDAGETGEIVVRGPTVMVGYFRRPELDAERGRGGWHHTGDLGRREVDGSITFVGPMTRIIKSAAENIYPAEVEGCLRAHDAVDDVCVIGVPDPTWTQSVRAVVVRGVNSRVSAEELIEYCRTRIASYKKPRDVVFADALPRTPQGAVDRDAVDAEFGGGGYPGSAGNASVARHS